MPTHSINLIQYLPLLIGHPKALSSLNSPLQLARPHFEVLDLLILQKLLQSLSKLGFGKKS